MSDKSVLHIVQTPLDYVGGPATYVRELSKHLSMNGVRVGILSPKPSRLSEEVLSLKDKYGVTFHFVKPGLMRSLIRTPLVYSLKAHKEIVQVLKDYDVINVHVEATLLQSFTSLFDNKELLLTVHSIYPFEDIETIKHHPLNPHRLIHLLAISPQHVVSLKRLSARSKYVIPVSSFLADMLKNYYKIPREKIIVVPNSVDTDLFNPQPFDKALEIVNRLLSWKGYGKHLDNEKIILFLGRLEPRKGLHVLIKSLCMLNDKSWSLIIVGGGGNQYLKTCLELAEKCNVQDRIFFIGRIPGSLLKYVYSSAYVYVLPTVFEGLPATVLEAMACGAPVIATRVSGVPEVVRHNLTGIIIEKPDPSELARAIELMLDDESLRRKLSVNGLNYIREHFSWQNNVKKYIELLVSERL